MVVAGAMDGCYGLCLGCSDGSCRELLCCAWRALCFSVLHQVTNEEKSVCLAVLITHLYATPSVIIPTELGG